MNENSENLVLLCATSIST